MSERALPMEAGRWPQSGPAARSPFRALLLFWATLAGCATAGAAVLQALGPPQPSQAAIQSPDKINPAAAVSSATILPQEAPAKTSEPPIVPPPAVTSAPAIVPTEATTAKAADPSISTPPDVTTMPTVTSAPTIPPAQETSAKAADPPLVAPPPPASAEAPAGTRPVPRQPATRQRQRPAADPIQAALSRLRRQQAPPRDEAGLAAPTAATPYRSLGPPEMEGQKPPSDLSPWQPPFDRDPNLASEPPASFAPDPAEPRWWPPQPPGYNPYPPTGNYYVR
jgi:hypothetical protein